MVVDACSAATPRQGKEEERNWSLQQRQGQRWINGLPWSHALPHVDWTRYHVQASAPSLGSHTNDDAGSTPRRSRRLNGKNGTPRYK